MHGGHEVDLERPAAACLRRAFGGFAVLDDRGVEGDGRAVVVPHEPQELRARLRCLDLPIGPGLCRFGRSQAAFSRGHERGKQGKQGCQGGAVHGGAPGDQSALDRDRYSRRIPEAAQAATNAPPQA